MRTQDALALLGSLGATPWLVRHHELVGEAAAIVCDRFARELGLVFDRDVVLLGAVLHDAGKIVHPAEMSAPGHEHELAGRQLLVEHGVAPAIARFCVTHAGWDAADATVEDLLVALADKLWKGKRDEGLEQRIVTVVAERIGRPTWDVFDRVDAICDNVAAGGAERLARSVV